MQELVTLEVTTNTIRINDTFRRGAAHRIVVDMVTRPGGDKVLTLDDGETVVLRTGRTLTVQRAMGDRLQ